MLRTSDLRRRVAVSGEDGFALPAALLAILAVSALISVMFATAITERRATRESQDFENAVHAAEAAVDATITVLNEDNNYVDSGVVRPAGQTAEQEHTWAIGVANAAAQSRRTIAANGWSYAFRPLDAAGDPLNLIYGVGTITVNDAQTRVIKVAFDAGYFRPEHAVLTQGNLRITNPAAITGEAGSAHANGTVTLGSNPIVEDGVTSTGAGTGAYRGSDGVSHPPVHADAEDVPEISAETFYEQRLRQETATDPGTSGTWFADGPTPTASGKNPLTYDGDWFDMCIQLGQPTAAVRVPADEGADACTGAVYRILHRTSCGGAIELDPSHPDYADDNSLFRGWHAHDDYWHICDEFPEDAGIFYLEGGAGKSTKIGVDTVTHSSRITIISDHGLEMENSMMLEPFLEGYLLQAEGTLEIKGEHTLTGAIASRQCVQIDGEGDGTTITGSIISNNEGGCLTELEGDLTITYDGGLAIPVGGMVRVTAWNELFQ